MVIPVVSTKCPNCSASSTQNSVLSKHLKRRHVSERHPAPHPPSSIVHADPTSRPPGSHRRASGSTSSVRVRSGRRSGLLVRSGPVGAGRAGSGETEPHGTAPAALDRGRWVPVGFFSVKLDGWKGCRKGPGRCLLKQRLPQHQHPPRPRRSDLGVEFRGHVPWSK